MSKDLEHIDRFFEQKIGQMQSGAADQGWSKLSTSIANQQGKFLFLHILNWKLLSFFSFFLVSLLGLPSVAIYTTPYSTYESSLYNGNVTSRTKAASFYNASPLHAESSQEKQQLAREQQIHLANYNNNENTRFGVAQMANANQTNTNHYQAPESEHTSITNEEGINCDSKTVLTKNNNNQLFQSTSSINKDLTRFNLNKSTGNKKQSISFLKSKASKLNINSKDKNDNLVLSNSYISAGDSSINWSIALFSGVFHTDKSRFTANPNQHTFGIKLSACQQNWHFESGISYTKINDEVLFDQHRNVLSERAYWEFYQYVNYNIDTVAYYCQVNSADTTWIPVIDTETTVMTDSVIATAIDTIHLAYDTIYTNAYSYIEIPLIIGYNYNKGRSSFILKTGVINSILNKASAYSQHTNDENMIIKVSKNNLPIYNIDIYAGIEARYFISNNYFLFSDFYYRKALTPFISNYKTDPRTDKFGVNLGFGIRF